MSKRQEQNRKLSRGCPNYSPCPICFACENKAVHLYEACQTCQVPIDSHNHVAKTYMIKRENFRTVLTPETAEEFAKLDADAVHA
jgi:predicted amidophosphoribosyltransferase